MQWNVYNQKEKFLSEQYVFIFLAWLKHQNIKLSCAIYIKKKSFLNSCLPQWKQTTHYAFIYITIFIFKWCVDSFIIFILITWWSNFAKGISVYIIVCIGIYNYACVYKNESIKFVVVYWSVIWSVSLKIPLQTILDVASND